MNARPIDISRKLLVALVPLIIAATPLAAHAATFTFDGAVPDGTDPLGGSYHVGPFGGGIVNFQEGAGNQPDPTQQVLFDPTGSGLANANSFTLTVTGSSDKILPLDFGYGNFFETFNADSTILSDWTASVNDAGTSITYTAAPGDTLLPGQRFSATTTFATFNTLPADFAYTITWTGDPTATAAVPEVATWGMMILGFGAIGSALRRGKRSDAKAGHKLTAIRA